MVSVCNLSGKRASDDGRQCSYGEKTEDVIPSNIFGKLVSFGVSLTITAAIFFHDMTAESCPQLFPVLFTILTVLTIAAFVIYLISSIKCLKKKSIDLDARSGRLKL